MLSIHQTPETLAPYSHEALRLLLTQCPNITGVTLRTHGESGVPEESYPFWKTVFSGITAAGRKIEIDQHAIDLRYRVPTARRQNAIGAHQNRKYRCAIGSTVAGSQVSNTPSARTS